MPSAVIFGCAGPTLSDEERAFFAEADPLGFIIFKRNVETPGQLRSLCADLRACVGRDDAPILIDQEGGRVQRLQPPFWRAAPPARTFGELFRRDQSAGLRAIELNTRLIAHELTDVGVNVDCLPCLDVPVPGAHDVIGDRAFSDDVDVVIACGRAAGDALLAGGVLPIAKHVPGHGRAGADSHHDLPRVNVSMDCLLETDFRPFRALCEMPVLMTAHIVFQALDPDRPVTQSLAAIRFLRRELGLDGFLMTDDLSMKALSGGFADRARTSLDAGCDCVLHCNGDMAEMVSVLEGTRPLSDDAARRWSNASGLLQTPKPFDPDAALAELSALLA
ncbi:MAG: beta-N-acetylhexosaminidase [Alphaproteobacteria bacterium]